MQMLKLGYFMVKFEVGEARVGVYAQKLLARDNIETVTFLPS